MAIFFGRKLAISLYFNSLDQWIFSLPLSIFNNYSQQEITFQQKTSKGKNVIAPCPRAFSFFFSFFFFLVKLQQVEIVDQSRRRFFSQCLHGGASYM